MINLVYLNFIIIIFLFFVSLFFIFSHRFIVYSLFKYYIFLSIFNFPPHLIFPSDTFPHNSSLFLHLTFLFPSIYLLHLHPLLIQSLLFLVLPSTMFMSRLQLSLPPSHLFSYPILSPLSLYLLPLITSFHHYLLLLLLSFPPTPSHLASSAIFLSYFFTDLPFFLFLSSSPFLLSPFSSHFFSLLFI